MAGEQKQGPRQREAIERKTKGSGEHDLLNKTNQFEKNEENRAFCLTELKPRVLMDKRRNMIRF